MIYRIICAWFEIFAAAEQSSGNFVLSNGCFYPSDVNLQWSSGYFYPSDGSFLSSDSNFRQSNGSFQQSSAHIVFERRSAFGGLLRGVGEELARVPRNGGNTDGKRGVRNERGH